MVKTLQGEALECDLTDVFREARLLRKLNHPVILGVHECEFADALNQDRPYIVLDYFPGDTLESQVQQSGALPQNDLLMIARQIAQGMLAAHHQGILHRDIKPDKVLVRKEGNGWKVKIVDFGLSLRKQIIEASMGARPAGDTILGDSVVGTVKYAPPEQLGELPGVKPGPYSDVFAFGKTCCYSLFQTTEPSSSQWEEISAELADMLAGCIEPRLEKRLPSFEPVLRVLETLDPIQAQHRKKAEAREQADLVEGETRLSLFVREALDRGQGKLTPDDIVAAKVIKILGHIPKNRALGIVSGVKAQWLKDHPLTTERKPGEIITNSLGMQFAWIPPGTFLMGSAPDEEGRSSDEALHKVTLTRGFYLGVCTVTQEEWQAVMGNNPSHFQGEKNLPVEQVSWQDCQEFLQKLRDRDQKPYRLPTESEWEYACRAGTTTPFFFGESIAIDQANYHGNYTYGPGGKKGVYRQKTTPVGFFPKNDFGLFDMHGNVMEWCQDWFGVYPQKEVVDPQGAITGRWRVLRGGSWFNLPRDCRSAYRLRIDPTYHLNCYGFRVCFIGE